MGPAAAPLRADRISSLTDPAFVSAIVGDVETLEEEPMGTPGFSGSTHTRYRALLKDGGAVSLVLKRTLLDRDWTAFRSHDRVGREAMLLAAPELGRVWTTFALPYVAYALEDGAVGLLMHDLAPYLVRDVREPLEAAQEDAILDHLASLHAAFWEADLSPSEAWLAHLADGMNLIGPSLLAEGPNALISNAALEERVREGWPEAFRRLPARVVDLLKSDAAEHERAFAHLPRTLVHGDVKVANFAFIPGGRIAAFDWAFVGQCPVAIDLGWYLAVNASRLTCSRDELVRRYRARLEARLGRAIGASEWRDQERLAVLSGALKLLWSKALALRDGRAGAAEDWNWWVERLKDFRA